MLNTGALYAGEGVKMKDTFDVIFARKSVRHFTGKAVDKADLDKMVRAGMAAPTAVNMQPWSFVVITDRPKLDKLAEALTVAKAHAQMLSKAGAAIIVCAEPAKAFGASQDFAIIDASLASENILLAAEALDLGALWTAAYPDRERMQAVRDILAIPENVIPLNVIPVGHPTGEDKPKDKYKKEKLHWEKW
jgi:nitroreductase